MSQMSDYLEAQLLNLLFRTQTAWKPSAIYVAACTAGPTDSSTGSTITEPVGNGYQRVQVTQLDANWNAPTTGGLTDNVNAITFPTASGGSWGTITHIAICDASTNGNLLLYGTLTASKTVGDGDTLRINAGDLDVTFA